MSSQVLGALSVGALSVGAISGGALSGAAIVPTANPCKTKRDGGE